MKEYIKSMEYAQIELTREKDWLLTNRAGFRSEAEAVMKHCHEMYDTMVQSGTVEISRERFISFASTQENIKLKFQCEEREEVMTERANMIMNAKSIVVEMRKQRIFV